LKNKDLAIKSLKNLKTYGLILSGMLAMIWLFSMFGCGLGARFLFSSPKKAISASASEAFGREEVWFPAPDGTLLYGWLIPAKKAFPLILYFYGNATNIAQEMDNLAFLKGLGQPLFIFDYRGFGQSHGRTRSEKTLFEDARAALDILKKRGWAPEQIVYYGRSMGGAIALQMAIETPPAGVVLESAFTSLSDIAWHLTPVTYVLVGWWNISNHFDNLHKIANISQPLLIFQGEMDSTVPVEMSRRLFKQAKEPKTLHLVKGAGHSDAFQVGGDDYRNAWMDFISGLR